MADRKEIRDWVRSIPLGPWWDQCRGRLIELGFGDQIDLERMASELYNTYGNSIGLELMTVLAKLPHDGLHKGNTLNRTHGPAGREADLIEAMTLIGWSFFNHLSDMHLSKGRTRQAETA